jgi:feruloyl esterase
MTHTAPDGEVFTNLPASCRVAATLMPTSDSNIKIELRTPYSGWNGRYVKTGNGGIARLIRYLSLATSSTSTMPLPTPTGALPGGD